MAIQMCIFKISWPAATYMFNVAKRRAIWVIKTLQEISVWAGSPATVSRERKVLLLLREMLV